MASQLNICNLGLLEIGEDVITQSELDNESTRPAKLCSKFWAYMRDEVLEAHSWNFAKKHRLLDKTDDFAEYAAADATAISCVTKADPAVVTSTTHNLATGNLGLIKDVSGMTQLNQNVYEVEFVDADNVKLVGVDSTKYDTYTTGGTIVRHEALPKYSNGYTYDVPSDCLKPLTIGDDPENQFEVIGHGDNKRILTTIDDPILVYIEAITDPTQFSNRFVQALAARIAGQLAIPLHKKGASFETMMAKYDFQITQAKLRDSRENVIKEKTTDPWLKAAGYE